MRWWEQPAPVIRKIILPEPPLTEVELARAFAVGGDHPLWVAIVQVINDLRENSVDAAATHVASGNQTAAAGAMGAAEVLKSLIFLLNERREAAVRE